MQRPYLAELSLGIGGLFSRGQGARRCMLLGGCYVCQPFYFAVFFVCAYLP